MDKVRYAVVGAGWISQEAFMPAVPQVENAEVTAIVTGNTDSAERLAEFYGIDHTCGYEGYDGLLASNLIDAVYVALPNSLHADYAIRAMKAGKHALVEKPLAVSESECQAMIQAASVNNVHLMTAYRLHAEPMTVAALETIRNGDIGEAKLFNSTFGFQSTTTTHRLQGEHWGGPLRDIGVYCLNAARQVFADEPVEAHAMKGHGNGDPRFTEVEGSMSVTLRFPRDRLAQFTISFESGDIDTFRVVGSDGVLEVLNAFEFKGGETRELAFLDSDHFGGQLAYFSDCILSGQAPTADGAEGLADVRALLAIEASAKSGQPQRIEPTEIHARPGPATVRIVPRTDRRLVL